MKNFMRASTVFVLFSLAGCVGGVEIPYDRSGMTIKTIGVLTPEFPTHPTVRLASDVGQSFGLIGGLIDAKMELDRDDKLVSMMSGQAYDARKAFVADLTTALEAHGYTVKVIPVDRPKSDFLPKYPDPTASGADAYLDIALQGAGYGYIAAGMGSSLPYRPFVWANCKLVGASKGEALMQDTIFYNPFGSPSKVVSIAADPAYSFPDMDALSADPKRTVEGMDASLKQTADTIATLLR